jgi:hypothetical protein
MEISSTDLPCAAGLRLDRSLGTFWRIVRTRSTGDRRTVTKGEVYYCNVLASLVRVEATVRVKRAEAAAGAVDRDDYRATGERAALTLRVVSARQRTVTSSASGTE